MKTGELILLSAVIGLLITNGVVIYKLNNVSNTLQPMVDKLDPIVTDVQDILTRLKNYGL